MFSSKVYPNHKPIREYCQKHFLHSFKMEGFISTMTQKLLNICRYESGRVARDSVPRFKAVEYEICLHGRILMIDHLHKQDKHNYFSVQQ